MRLLIRTVTRRPDGRISVLLLEHPDGALPLCVALDTGMTPPGDYVAKRGRHRLHPDSPDFDTFEITGIVGHSGVLFHKGNTIADTRNCFLVGQRLGALAGKMAVLDSEPAFVAFMRAFDQYDSFDVRVEDPYFVPSNLN